MYRCGPVVARACTEPSEQQHVSMLLQDLGLWQGLALHEPLERVWVDDTVRVTLPSGTRHTKVHVSLAFDAEHNRLLALLVDYGWEHSLDRVRIAEVAILDHLSSEREGDVVDALLGHLFGERRVHAVRARTDGVGAKLGAWLSKCGTAEAMDLDGRRWLQLARPRATLRSTPVSGELVTVQLHNAAMRKAERAVRGLRPAPVWKTRREVPIQVRNPAIAHRYLLQGGAPQRSLIFGTPRRTEETDVLVVGAGVAGLSAAYALRPRQTLVLEVDDRIGGTGAAEEGPLGRFPLGAHYEHNPATWFGADVVRLYQELDIIGHEPEGNVYPFKDRTYCVDPLRHEQFVGRDGQIDHGPWDHPRRGDALDFTFDGLVQPFLGRMTLPIRLTGPELRPLADVTFGAWLRAEKLTLNVHLRDLINTGLRSDYGGGIDVISAYAALHFLSCRPYVTGAVSTLSPPEGLALFAERLLERTPSATVRTGRFVRKLFDRGDHVEALVVNVDEGCLERVRAKHVIFAAPKKAVPYIFPADAALFRRNTYSGWIIVTMEMRRLPELDLLYWSNGAYDPENVYVGTTWANHHRPSDPPIIGHYMVYPPGRVQHLRPYAARPQALVRKCLQQLARIVGRDVSADVDRVVIQKLGHAMPSPIPGSLFYDPNARRSSPRIVYAGVDIGRLPLLVDAMDSGLQAAGLVQ